VCAGECRRSCITGKQPCFPVMSSFCGLAGVPPLRGKPAAENRRVIATSIDLAMLPLMDGWVLPRRQAEELRAVDPDLQTLRNLNTPEDYAAALREEPPAS
jgi:hypothetical protein